MKRYFPALLFATACIAQAAPYEAAHLGPLGKIVTAPAPDARGRLRVGTVRELPAAASIGAWAREEGRYVARFQVTAEGALGLRTRLDLGRLPGAMELRATGTEGPTETMRLDPVLGPEAWTPWTDGATQVIELVSAVRPAADAVRVGALLDLATTTTGAKAAASCSVSTACPTGDPVLDAAVAERRKSIFRISFVDQGNGFVCSATLLDTPLKPAAYALTANHCIPVDSAAASITGLWFFDTVSCTDLSLNPARVQVAGGAQLVFPSRNADMSLLLLNAAPPPGALYAPVNPAHLATADAVVGLSFPRGDASRITVGTIVGEDRNFDLPYNMYLVQNTKGIIEPGSSGSGLFTLSGGTLQLRGVTSAAEDTLSCTNTTAISLYGRMEVFQPEIAQYIGLTALRADDEPNRVRDYQAIGITQADPDIPLDKRASATLDFGTKSIDFPGDVDTYRFFLSAPAVVTATTSGAQDTVGLLTDSQGRGLQSNDDAQTSNTNMGLTAALDAGTYYVQVAHWDPQGTGPYNLTLHTDLVEATNHTNLWWNPAEPGWGLNVNHQGNIVFGTLFTYDTDGTPMWLVLSNGARQPDGSYSGPLYRTTGPVFNAQPWTAISLAVVGSMTLRFASASTGSLDYTVNGVAVHKDIQRQDFSTVPTCTWSSFDRSYAFNYQDLWWNPAESGWGLNIAHQGTILFATLFTYGADNKARWYVMSSGNRTAAGLYSGTLYRTAGPAFNANPWVPATVTAVGTMQVQLTNGNAATLTYTVDGTSVTKQIQRQVFSTPKVECSP
jgi:lysyl endopeptidase